MREKLIELLNEVLARYRFDAWENADKIADHLIANGVTVADVPESNVGKWISVSERLPEKSDDYLCAFDGYMDVIHFSAKHKAFNAYDSVAARFVEASKVSPTHWMPIPAPPKGE